MLKWLCYDREKRRSFKIVAVLNVNANVKDEKRKQKNQNKKKFNK